MSAAMEKTRAKLKIKKGDKVVVLTGKDKGVTGEVTGVDTSTSRVTVRGVNVATKNNKPSQSNPQGGQAKIERPIHVSNVAIADPKTGAASRVGYKMNAEGKKVRIARKSGEIVE